MDVASCIYVCRPIHRLIKKRRVLELLVVLNSGQFGGKAVKKGRKEKGCIGAR